MLQNIGGENAGDAFYRYKMPRLVAKIEGRGNGIKTNVVNNADIAKALDRPPEYVLKYFGCELGAQINYEPKTGNSIVNGAHDTRKLCELLEGFIKKYVQCYECGNPETLIQIRKEMIYLKCRACGGKSTVDMRHKVNTFILKNPPENKMSKEERKLRKAEEERLKVAKENEMRDKKEKKEKRKKRRSKKGDEEGDNGEGDEEEEQQQRGEEEDEAGGDDKVVWMTDTSAEAMARRAKEQLSAATAAMVTVGNVPGEAEAVAGGKDTTGAAAAPMAAPAQNGVAPQDKALENPRAEMDSLVQKAVALQLDDKLDRAKAAQIVGLLLDSHPNEEVARILKKLNVEGGVAGRLLALVEALLSGAQSKASEVLLGARDLLRACVADEAGQLALLIALESWLGVHATDKVKESALTCKMLYDEDVVEEHVFEAWFDRGDAGKALGVPADAAKKVRTACTPFMTWLRTADAEDEDEDDED